MTTVKVSFVSASVNGHVEVSSKLLMQEHAMLENATTLSTRDALTAAHRERGAALIQLLGWIRGRK